MASDVDGVARLLFPISFPYGVYTIVGIHAGGDIAIVSEISTYHHPNSACLWVKQADGAVNTFGLNWFAIGV